MSATAATDSLPQAAPGSTRYFVLLYCPGQRRRALATLLALTDELDAGRARSVDHSVAHVRLDWWREELRRFARGAPTHPWLSAWLRERPQDQTLELERLTEAAAIDLAAARLASRSEHCLGGAVFVLGAQLLGIDAPTAQLKEQLRALGCYRAALEHDTSAAAPMALDPAAQPPLTPLLVWVGLVERKAARRPRTAGRFDMLADNLLAWRAARRAQRGRFTSTQPTGGVSR